MTFQIQCSLTTPHWLRPTEARFVSDCSLAQTNMHWVTATLQTSSMITPALNVGKVIERRRIICHLVTFAGETQKNKWSKVVKCKNCKNTWENQKNNPKNKILVCATSWPVTLDKKLVVQVFGFEAILRLCYIMGWNICKIRWIYKL